MKQSKGFTLVELAIVITIVGLLIGGALKGQELVSNARLKATIAEIKAFQTAAIAFRDIYNAWPGDLLNAETRIPGCTPGCAIWQSDGFLGYQPWGTPWRNYENGDMGQVTPGATYVSHLVHRAGMEPWLFWMHLNQANLIRGVKTDGLNRSIPLEWGNTHPALRYGGGFIVRNNPTGTLPPGSTSTDPNGGPRGIMLITQRDSTGGQAGIPNGVSLTTQIAYQLDLKMDDGVASKGDVQAYGFNASCYIAGNDTSYNLSIGAVNQCGLLIKILD